MTPHFYFFFSSRRRHTRWPRDWSSDVCSSDLQEVSESVREGMLVTDSGARDPPVLHVGVLEARDVDVPPAVQMIDVGVEIGRASCRERVWIGGGAGSLKEKMTWGVGTSSCWTC